VSFPFSPIDWFALAWFGIAWLGFAQLIDRGWLGASLSQAMDGHRRQWMHTLIDRDLRIIDTSIMAGLQNGTAFFASTSLLALGGSLTLLSQTERMIAVLTDLAITSAPSPAEVEWKVVGLALIYAYAFFKFGWAYRLFNYASILIGAVPLAAERDTPEALFAADRSADMQISAARHFNRGLRAFFFSLGFLGWFLGPLAFLVTTTLVLIILLRRQFGSEPQRIAARAMGEAPSAQGAGKSASDRPANR
jgi:uncharacterized membrane protein